MAVTGSDAVAAAWEEWLAALHEAGRLLRASRAPDTALDRAEGHRYLSRLATTALWMFVEHGDPLHPTLYRNVDEHKKFGVDNPDNVYLRCALDAGGTYRLSGWRGEAPYFGITVGADFYGGSRSGGTLSQHHLDEFALGPDGRFELFLGPGARPGNWIPLAPGATGLILRQTFTDRAAQRPAELAIERVGGGGAPPPLDPERMAAGLRRGGAFVLGCVKLFLRMADGWASRPNELIGATGASTRNLHGDPDIFYCSGYWRLAPDEALVVEVRPAERFLYWGFQLCNYWLESLDYTHRPVATNCHRAVGEADGSARLVVAHSDPGVPNWLDTAGHGEGAMCFRWLLAGDDPPVPSVRVVKRAALRA